MRSAFSVGVILGVIHAPWCLHSQQPGGSDARSGPVRHKGFGFTIRHSQIAPTSLPLYLTILTPTSLAPLEGAKKVGVMAFLSSLLSRTEGQEWPHQSR